MKFLDNEHKQFYEQKLKETGKSDVYRRALIYTLAICPVTRKHFKDIFDVKNGEININSINAPYQTGSSVKVTRLAFSLWNRCNYDSEEDIENNKLSNYYNVSEIFCCSYAPYFYEAIKIRYPEYTKVNNYDVLENTITDVINLIRKKYSTIVNIILVEDVLTLEYLHTINNEKDCFQLMNITEFENKLSIEFVPQHIGKVIDIQELENIFEMLHRKSTRKKHTDDEIKAIKNQYATGTKIRLIKMYDLQAVPSETTGTVTKVDDIGQLQVKWENGSTLALNVGVDDFEIIENKLEEN